MRMTGLVTPPRVAAWGGLVAALVAIAAAIGVFARGDGSAVLVTSPRGEVFEMATSGVYANNALAIVAEGVGWDVFTLLVVVPALAVTAFFVARGSFSATLIAAGLIGYVAYLHLEYAVTWAFGPLFPLFAATLAAAMVGMTGAVVLAAKQGIAGRFAEAFPRRSWAALSVGMGVLLLVMWSARIIDGLGASVPALHGESTMTVQALDLGLVLPVTIVIAVAAWRRDPVGLAAAAGFSVTFVTLCAAIAAMMVSSWIVTGVSALPPTAVFGLASIGGLWLSVRMFSGIDDRQPVAASEALRSAEIAMG
jgi:hypothetical protein